MDRNRFLLGSPAGWKVEVYKRENGLVYYAAVGESSFE